MNKDLSLKFGRLIREIRHEKKLSQEELAFRADVHRTYVGMIERGEKNITLENIDKFCKGLEVTMEFVFHKLKDEN
ncbi:XRE family transcriptional regulator [Flavobacterium crocinum]|uniref:XRE family transcriptional regulator n=1 Tax=Flavobacterium crocinum TaxID=2183896 RepID=A0A2S1YKJ1_9FLAO|nr:helix-turn-helix transcriptional regulator [Flavobacterium crocinum]AWK04562.1 XRE family transcriptional regulator [Flavobacterium crocinum]